MEHKINDIITYNFKDENIYLEVIHTKANSCEDCFFYKNEKTCCSAIRNIIGECDKNNRTDKTPVIFRKIIKKKKTIDIYVVMQVYERCRDFCDVYTSFEEADNRFKQLLKTFEDINNVKAEGWTTPNVPSQIKVSIIGDITLYLCKETKEIDIEVDSNKQSSDIYKKDVLGKWISINDINPIKIKDIKAGDYVILRVQYDSIKFDYKLAYVDCIRNGKVMFNIQNINILRTPIKITDFCIFPDYISNNFYKINNK